ncbi:RNA-binding (RRM/RBD/RNP motifs) family protein [Trifolium repens]|nr:RNA-binding (RRM/RBD/RNP motifs) family protein [Trifolium repens]
MPRYKDESPAVRVYTVSDESRYLIVRNVPALGCGNDLLQLFSTYGQVEECKPMDAEDCEQFTDVYWIKFLLFSNARFAKRKLDEFVFLGNRLQVSYAPHFESLSDTKDKLEGRRREVLARLNPGRSKETIASNSRPLINSNTSFLSEHLNPNQRNVEFEGRSNNGNLSKRTVSSNEDYFASPSMNQTVRIVRDKLDKIQSSGEHLQAASASKKARVDNRRRI